MGGPADSDKTALGLTLDLIRDLIGQTVEDAIDRRLGDSGILIPEKSAGNFLLNPNNSTVLPIVAQVEADARLNADVFDFRDLFPFLSETAPTFPVTLTADAVGTAGSDTITVAQFAAAGAIATVDTAPAWLVSDADEYRVALAYFYTNPSKLDGVNIQSSENKDDAPLLEALNITAITQNAFGRNDQNTIPTGSFQYSTAYMQNRVTVPLNLPMDLLHHLLFTTTVPAAALTTFSLSFSVSKRNESFRSIWAPMRSQPGGPSVDLNRSLNRR